MSDESDNGEDDTSVGLSYAMDALTVGYTSIKPGADGSFGDEWDFLLIRSWCRCSIIRN